MLKSSRAEEGEQILKEISEKEKTNVESRLLLANHLAARDYKAARKMFETVLQTINNHNGYALVAVGNYWLASRRAAPKNEEKMVCRGGFGHSSTHLLITDLQREDFRKRAWEFFEKSMRICNTNIYGAMGLGTLLAETGQWDAAAYVFNQVCSESEICRWLRN